MFQGAAMHVIVNVSHEDVPALVQLTASVYRHRIVVNSTYSRGKYESGLEGERHMVDKICCVAADIEQRVAAYLRKQNDKAKLTLQENRRV